jgi:hypothetical protein
LGDAKAITGQVVFRERDLVEDSAAGQIQPASGGDLDVRHRRSLACYVGNPLKVYDGIKD